MTKRMGNKYKKKKTGIIGIGNTRGESVTLSQCMIVKNEERNIEKALSWAKDIAFEQIVVDTGSTDRTVEIAESMGAKVYHFEWIKDFAAAKNYAIEQAAGTWIAFLDADEYIEQGEAGKVLPLLELINSDPKMRRNYLAVNCPWIQLNDEGQAKEVLNQERIFRNLPLVRYVGKIHERLSLKEKDIVQTKDFRIMHTGYTGESYLLTGKSSRNTEILRTELLEKPDDINLKAYLALSLKSELALELHKSEDPANHVHDPEKMSEMERLFEEALKNKADLFPMLRQSTYDYYMEKYCENPDADIDLNKMCMQAYSEFPNEPRFMCYYAMMLNKNGQYKDAYDVLKKCEASLEESIGNNELLTTKVMGILLAQMVLAAQGLGDTDTVLAYAEIMLLSNKSNLNVLRPYLATLLSKSSSYDDVFAALARIYDMSSKRDLLLIARSAKDVGAIDLAKRIIDVAGYLGES